MRSRSILVSLLLVVTTVGLSFPVDAVPTGCEEDCGFDCCGLDCAPCICCSHAPQTILGDLDCGVVNATNEWLGPEKAVKPLEPLPRKVLHVPKPALDS